MATTARCLAAILTAALVLALGAARPQFGFFTGPSAPQEQPPAVPSPDDGAASVPPGRGSVSVTVSQPATNAPSPPFGATATLGQCPSNASRLLNEPVARLPIHGMRVATRIRYDGRGCFAERECTVSCVRIDAPDRNWRPTTMSITDGGLGLSGIEVTITSAVNSGYSVRVLIYGYCQ